MLNFCAWKREPSEFSSLRMELEGGSEHVGLLLPLFLAGTDDDGRRRHQFFETLDVAREPEPPHPLPHT
jgi:hypothetical protein